MTYSKHYSVLKNEAIGALVEKVSKGLFADLTFGAGGHTIELAQLGHHVVSVDQDPEAIANGKNRLKELDLENRVDLIYGNFNDFADYDRVKELKQFDGILMDLGVSSHHFDNPERGFSFRHDALLDMRMNNGDDSIETASEILNSRDVDELTEIFEVYGEERYARRIAENIVEKRQQKGIERTGELEDIIFHCYPKKFRHGKTNPSTRCFQALRIAVNDELRVLEQVIPKLLPLLNPGARLAIISFHSLEDRIVKHSFKRFAGEKYKILTKKPIIPSETEILENNRSRSAKLRVIESL